MRARASAVARRRVEPPDTRHHHCGALLSIDVGAGGYLVESCRPCKYSRVVPPRRPQAAEVEETSRAAERRNKAKIAERQRSYSAANKAKIAERQRSYYAANKAKIAERKRSYSAANKAKIAEGQRSYYAANKAKIAEGKRAAWAAAPPRCSLCGAVLTYSGRGRPPKFCAADKPGSRARANVCDASPARHETTRQPRRRQAAHAA
jgi:DNA-binding protein H-NS